jgi:hypothetical protein
VLNCIFEEYKIHLVAVSAVIVFEHSIENLHELVSVLDFLIELDRGLKLEEVTEHNFLLDEDYVMLHVDSEASVKELDNQVSEPGLVLVIDKTIEEYSLSLVNPEFRHNFRVLH